MKFGEIHVYLVYHSVDRVSRQCWDQARPQACIGRAGTLEQKTGILNKFCNVMPLEMFNGRGAVFHKPNSIIRLSMAPMFRNDVPGLCQMTLSGSVLALQSYFPRCKDSLR